MRRLDLRVIATFEREFFFFMAAHVQSQSHPYYVQHIHCTAVAHFITGTPSLACLLMTVFSWTLPPC